MIDSLYNARGLFLTNLEVDKQFISYIIVEYKETMMRKSQRVSSGLDRDSRTIVAELKRIEGPKSSRYGGDYYTVRWRLPDGMRGHTDIGVDYRNYKLWRTWLEVAEENTYWVVVVADDLSRSTPTDVCIDADYKPYNAEEFLLIKNSLTVE